jgi:hypothetical protein
MRRFSTTLAIAISTMLLISVSSAQQTATTSVPNLIRYSGTFKDAQGAALSSSTAVGVTFSIYKQQDGGGAVWMETQNVTPDSNGQYNVILGSTTATGLPDDLFSQQEQRWLGVQVQGEAEQARVLLVSVPYAFKAHEAETLGGLPASAFVQAATSGATGTEAGTAVNALSNAGSANINSKGKSAVASGKNGLTTCNSLSANASANYISVFSTVCILMNSAISQDSVPSPSVVNDSVNFNLSSTANSYQIGGNNVLSVQNQPFYNLFVGVGAGSAGSGGIQNTFIGFGAGGGVLGASNGNFNTFTGVSPGASNTTGLYNTAYGYQAGIFNANGNSNVYLANFGANESNTIRIGNPGNLNGQQNVTFIAGIANAPSVMNPANVYIDPFGKLSVGTIGSGVSGSCNSPANSLAKWTTGVTLGCAKVVDNGNGILSVNEELQVGGGVGNNQSLIVTGDTNIDGNLNATGVGTSTTVWALEVDAGPSFFSGNLTVSGNLSVGGAKHFMIDDPIDPANKFLYHASIESSEMMNLYTGNVVTDGQGDAVVQLPDWFEALNGDFRYQLTPIGQFAQVIVAKEIENGQFSIKTDKPNVKVSWQVTGVRHDAYAKAHPFHAEVDKPEPGYYIHPELFGAPPNKVLTGRGTSK